jgi:hypothetical protein
MIEWEFAANNVPDLREAAYIGNIDILKRLIEEEGVDVNEPHPVNKLTALHWAVKGDKAPAVRYLLQRGADVNATDSQGRKPTDFIKGDEVRKLFQLPSKEDSPDSTSISTSLPSVTSTETFQSGTSPSSLPVTESKTASSSPISFPLRGLTSLAEFGPINVGNVLNDIEKSERQMSSQKKRTLPSQQQKDGHIVGIITVKRIGKTIGKAITVYEDDTLDTLMLRIKEIFSQNDLTALLTTALGEITDIKQVFYICRTSVESVLFLVATATELADQ